MLQSILACPALALLLVGQLATSAVAASSGISSSDFGCPAPKASQPRGGGPVKCRTSTPIYVPAAPAPQTVSTQHIHVYCAPVEAASAASAVEGATPHTPGTPVKLLEECKKDSATLTELEVKLRSDLGFNIKTENSTLSYIATASAILFIAAVLIIAYKAAKEVTDSGSASELVVLVLIVAVVAGVLLGYWWKDDARTMLNEEQVKLLAGKEEFKEALSNTARVTEEAYRLQIRVADLERELSVARTRPQLPVFDSPIPPVNTLVYLGFGAVLGALLSGTLLLRKHRRVAELYNALWSIHHLLDRRPVPRTYSESSSDSTWEQHVIQTVESILESVLRPRPW